MFAAFMSIRYGTSGISSFGPVGTEKVARVSRVIIQGEIEAMKDFSFRGPNGFISRPCMSLAVYLSLLITYLETYSKYRNA